MTKKREKLIDTAIKLFFSQGYCETGIDLIIAQADVSKMTLYKHFTSKHDLLIAAIEKACDIQATNMIIATENIGKKHKKITIYCRMPPD